MREALDVHGRDGVPLASPAATESVGACAARLPIALPPRPTRPGSQAAREAAVDHHLQQTTQSALNSATGRHTVEDQRS